MSSVLRLCTVRSCATDAVQYELKQQPLDILIVGAFDAFDDRLISKRHSTQSSR